MQHHGRRNPYPTMSPSHVALSQLCLRPFDVGAALRLLLVPEERYEPMSQALSTSTSAVHRAVGRLRQAGICKPGTRTIDVDAVTEFATCGVPYVFPAIRAGSSTGMLTAFSYDEWSAMAHGGETLVWPSSHHASHGVGLVPLFPGAPQVAQMEPRMHRLLALVDAVRVADGELRDSARSQLERVLAATGP